MSTYREFVEKLSAYTGVETPWLELAILLLCAGIAHLAVGFIVDKLRRLALASKNYRWDDILVEALAGPIRFVVWVMAMYTGLRAFPATDGLRDLASQSYDTALVVLVACFLHRFVAGAEQELLRVDRGRNSSTDRAAVRATAKLIRVVLWIIAALMVLQTLGVSISGLLAFGGIGGIAVGFASKDLLANFFGGLSIYLDRPFTLGDWIRSPDRNIEGTVEDVGWRLTRIRTFDQRPLYVPNSVFTQISVENPSRMHNRRIYETIGLRYEDAGKVEAIINDVKQMLAEHPEIHPERTLIVNFVSFGASSLDFFVYAFTRTTDWVTYHQIKQEILLKILEIIHNHGADVAFPTQTLHVQGIEEEPVQ